MWGISSKLARIATCAISFCIPAAALAAAQWRIGNLAVTEQGRSITFIDVRSLAKKGERVSFRSAEYRERASGGYDRSLSSNSADCATMKLSVVRSTYYLGENLVGFSKAPQDSENYAEQSAAHWLIRRACEAQFLSDPVTDPRLAVSQVFSANWRPVAE